MAHIVQRIRTPSKVDPKEQSEMPRRRNGRSVVQKIKAALVPHQGGRKGRVRCRSFALRDKDAQMDGHEGYLEHEWASKTLQRLEGIANAASPEHKAAGKVLQGIGRTSY